MVAATPAGVAAKEVVEEAVPAAEAAPEVPAPIEVETVAKAGRATAECAADSAAATAEAAISTLEEASESSRRMIEALVRSSTDMAAEGYTRMISIGNENAGIAVQTVASIVKGYDQTSGLGRENFDALVASGRAAAGGMEDVGESFASLMRHSTDNSIEALRAVLGCTNLRDLIEIQTTYAQKFFDEWFEESNRLGESSLKVASEIMKPLTARAGELWQSPRASV
ncbi:MAG: hypothetical protein CMM50_17220 [Rhodospirillaceae bacterium]|nr:hypothetical protein [Rhodospirillaceae bacterium]